LTNHDKILLYNVVLFQLMLPNITQCKWPGLLLAVKCERWEKTELPLYVCASKRLECYTVLTLNIKEGARMGKAAQLWNAHCDMSNEHCPCNLNLNSLLFIIFLDLISKWNKNGAKVSLETSHSHSR
jgi:hypothetical protein